MTYFHYERLSALDATFLELEDDACHMHIGSLALFDLEPLAGGEGGLDFQRIVESSEASLCRNVRFRQKLAAVPGLGHPVWVDDDSFNVLYHLRHSCLPAPGSLRALKRMAARVMSQKLDRGKPLWEMWFIEGIEGDRFAVITKIHHCLADGISGADLLAGMMGPDPGYRPRPPGRWVPRPAPSGRRLLADELARRATAPLSLWRSGARAVSQGAPAVRAASRGLEGLRDTFQAGLTPASETPFNADLGPHRRFDWTRFQLDDVREVKDRFGGKLNDVVLAVVAGAVRRFLRSRGLRVDDLEFRALVPVSVRAETERGALGNRVSQMLARLPVDEAEPGRRLLRVIETTRELKRSAQRTGGEALTGLAELTGSGAMAWLARLGLRMRAANMVVTNVPGSPQPIYMLGARMLEVYPVVPLAEGQTLGIALFSYDGGLHWGLNADWDAHPDLHHFVEALDAEFEVLRKAEPSSLSRRRDG